MSVSVPASSAAYDVLRDRDLLHVITLFQLGFPRDVIEFARLNNANGRYRMPAPLLAVRADDAVMLERIYRFYCEQRSAYDRNKERVMSFAQVWSAALREGKVNSAIWIDAHPVLRRDAMASFDMSSALTSGRVDIVAWLFSNVGERGHLELFKWLEANIENLACTETLMDIAAINGHLEFVRYLHEHRTEGCTTEAMDGAMRQRHSAIVRFLHKNRTEGATRDAMRYAARNNDLEMVRFLHEHRTEGCDEVALVKAVKRGHLEIVRFLHEHYHDQCSSEAVFEAARKGRFEVVQYLCSHCDQQTAGNSVVVAAENGHLEIVRYLVETRTDGCVFSALDVAQRLGHSAIVEYLVGVVDPKITACCMYTNHAEGEARRKCQRRSSRWTKLWSK